MTKFYSVYLSSNLQYHFELEKLHKQYGDVVRTEITKYDAPMQSMISLLLERLSAPELVGKPVNIAEWISWLSYDIMGIVGYGKDFGNLRTGTEHHTVAGMRKAMLGMGTLKPVPWVANFLSHFPGGQGAMGPFSKHAKKLVEEKRKNLNVKDLDAPNDIVTWLIKAFEEKAPYAAHTIEGLDDDSRALVIGGADTSSATLVIALYYLCTHPHIYTTLQSHVDTVFPGGPSTFTYAPLDSIPLLEAIITETLRLQPPVPSGQPRVTPPEGLHVPAGKGEEGDLYLPGDVVVLQPQWLIQRDERYFERADEFVPERWVAGSKEAAMVKERAAFFPFQIGMYHCVGKQLAMWEMKSVLARIALQFDISFAPGEDGKKFQAGILDTWTLTLPPLHMCLTERNVAKA
ncbi:Cytochrome P450 [Neofusicoccum parvum]|nr:Cytochrome P450 [Neofusicoccum parvum]